MRWLQPLIGAASAPPPAWGGLVVAQSLDISFWYYRPCLLVRCDELWGLRLLCDSDVIVDL